jgi:hypothetical protein
MGYGSYKGCIGLGCWSDGLFPLTPALSPRERENRRQSGGASQAAGVFEPRPLLFPLPKGEG